MGWLEQHWGALGIGGGGLGLLWRLPRIVQFFKVRRFVLQGESWKLSYHSREDNVLAETDRHSVREMSDRKKARRKRGT